MKIRGLFATLAISMWIFFFFFSVLAYFNRDYDVSFKSDTPSTLVNPLPERPEPSNTQITINPDGSTNITICASVDIHFNTQLSGNYFMGQKYAIYNLATEFQKLVGDLLEKFRDNYIDILIALIAFTTIPVILKRMVTRSS
jgi:hypothetical protein